METKKSLRKLREMFDLDLGLTDQDTITFSYNGGQANFGDRSITINFTWQGTFSSEARYNVMNVNRLRATKRALEFVDRFELTELSIDRALDSLIV